MRLLESALYNEDLGKVTGLDLDWESLRDRSIMISGATGMIGSTLIDVLMKKNREQGLGIRVLALGRNEEKARERFLEYWDCPEFLFLKCDITDSKSLRTAFLSVSSFLKTKRAGEAVSSEVTEDQRETAGSSEATEDQRETAVSSEVSGDQRETASSSEVTGDQRETEGSSEAASGQEDDPQDCDFHGGKMHSDAARVDFIFHAASNTHPVAYAQDPIGTITANIIGLNNLLDLAAEHGCRRFIFASSNEIYGENRGDVELFDESYCGYIDSNTLRAGYPESKRAGEALCQAYIRQRGLDAVVVRFTRSFGPSLLKTDTKALSQFLKKGVDGEDIVLKSAGTQFFSYTYVCDAVSGLLTCLLKGGCGEAYNIADVSCDITLKDLAKLIADYVGRRVIFEIPDAVESAGYSKATKARLDSTKLQRLGWKAGFDIGTGIRHTIEIMREMRKTDC